MTPRTYTTVDKLTRLRDIMQEVVNAEAAQMDSTLALWDTKPVKFHMPEYILPITWQRNGEHFCGTAACIVGHAMIDRVMEDMGLESIVMIKDTDNIIVKPQGLRVLLQVNAASHAVPHQPVSFFGMSSDDYSDLVSAGVSKLDDRYALQATHDADQLPEDYHIITSTDGLRRVEKLLAKYTALEAAEAEKAQTDAILQRVITRAVEWIENNKEGE